MRCMRRLKKSSIVVVLSLLLLISGSGGLNFDPISLAAAPYHFDLVGWELSNIPDKWLYKLKSYLPWNSRNREERLENLQLYFDLGIEIGALERELVNLSLASPDEKGNPIPIGGREDAAEMSETRLNALLSRRSGLRPGVEETLESEVSAVLGQEGFSSRFGLIFPPVDVVLARPPTLLVVSPRDRIQRTRDLLLQPDLKVKDMEALEERILQEQDLAALVEGIGGVATYPAILRDDSSIRDTAITAAHEWLHQYWFFRPMGWNIGKSSDMRTLNETAADVAGEELGTRVYERILEVISSGPTATSPPSGERDATITENDQAPKERDEETFDFNREMRTTRLRADELLAQGKVEEAEEYMEERRLRFVDNGYYIRKLNQAFFAFHGTYAGSAASVSPIGGEVDQLRSTSESLGEFIRTMAGFGSYQEFKDYLSGLSATGGSDYGTAISAVPTN